MKPDREYLKDISRKFVPPRANEAKALYSLKIEYIIAIERERIATPTRSLLIFSSRYNRPIITPLRPIMTLVVAIMPLMTVGTDCIDS